MAAIDATLFGLLAWGAIALVLAVFVYETYAVVREYRGASGDREPGAGQ